MFSFWIQPPFLSAQLTQALQGKNANLHWRSWLCKCQTAEVWTEAEPTSWKTQSSWNCLGIAKAQCSRLKHQGLKEHSSASTVPQQKFPQLHWHRTSWKCPMTVIPNHVSHSMWVWEPGWNNTPTPQTELNPPLEKTTASSEREKLKYHERKWLLFQEIWYQDCKIFRWHGSLWRT